MCHFQVEVRVFAKILLLGSVNYTAVRGDNLFNHVNELIILNKTDRITSVGSHLSDAVNGTIQQKLVLGRPLTTLICLE